MNAKPEYVSCGFVAEAVRKDVRTITRAIKSRKIEPDAWAHCGGKRVALFKRSRFEQLIELLKAP